MKTTLTAFTVLALSSFATFAHASRAGWYLGAQGGFVHSNQKTLTGTYNSTTYTFKPKKSGMTEGVQLGYNFSKYFAIEAGFNHFSDIKYDASPKLDGKDPTTRTNAALLVGKFMLPIDNFNLFFKGGAAYIVTRSSGILKTDTSGNTSKTSVDGDNVGYLIGLGAGYNFNQNVEIDASINRLQGGNTKLNYAALSISYHFVTPYCGDFIGNCNA